MALVYDFNPKNKFGGMYSPRSSRMGFEEGTHTGLQQKGAGRDILSEFSGSSYADYLKAYSTDPSKYAGSGSPGSAGYQGPSQWNWAKGGGSKASWNPFSERQFEQNQRGQHIASGGELEDASARAQQMLQDTMGGGPTGADAQMYDYYKELLQDPNSGMNTPQQAWLRQQGEETVRRTSPRLSGRRAIAAQEYGQGLASQEYGKTLAQRLSASGEEKSRWQAGQEGRNQSASLRAQLAMQPAMAKFNQYWQSEGA